MVPPSSSLFQDLHDLRPRLQKDRAIAGVVLVTGGWQTKKVPRTPRSSSMCDAHDTVTLQQRLADDALVGVHEQQALQIFSARISVDDNDDAHQSDLEFALQHLHIVSLSRSSASSSASSAQRRTTRKRTLPSTLPALALVYQNQTMEQSEWIFLDDTISPADLLYHVPSSTDNGAEYRRLLLRPLVAVVNRQLLSTNVLLNPTLPFLTSSKALRLFVAGDRSSVGKSSVCLGLLGNWYADSNNNDNRDHHFEKIAYIKPATQSESKQLIESYCDQMGLACVPVGPLVYYRGFTRAYLAGETADTAQLLNDCAHAVDLVARGQEVVLIDGVGFPAVGSICGTSNASVAAACRADAILLVGGPGVGAAVDAYHLNATYFATMAPHIPVVGAVFNKLPTSGYYNVDDCKREVTLYFDRQRRPQLPFGFVPESNTLRGGLVRVPEFLQLFAAHVDVAGILRATRAAAAARLETPAVLAAVEAAATVPPPPPPPPLLDRDPKRRKLATMPFLQKTRQEIEAAAIQAGAAPSA